MSYKRELIQRLKDDVNTSSSLIEALEDSIRLEYAMEHLFIVKDIGPQTRRLYDTRGAIDEAMEEDCK